jgi:hypothetical protein
MNSSAYERDRISLQLKTAIEEKKHLAVEHKFFIALPSEHRNHLSGEVYYMNYQDSWIIMISPVICQYRDMIGVIINGLTSVVMNF